MFKLFKTPVLTKPQLTDDEIKARAAVFREKMGTKFCAARGSTFQFKQGPTVLNKATLL